MPDTPPLTLDAARSEVHAWLRAATGASPGSDDELADAAAMQVWTLFGLDLRATWNPSACVFEARWNDRGRPADQLDRPFTAEERGAARLLACAGLLRVVKAIELPPPRA